MNADGVKKPIPLASYEKYNAKDYAKSKEVQKSFFEVNKVFSQTAGHSGFKGIWKLELSPSQLRDLPNQIVAPD